MDWVIGIGAGLLWLACGIWAFMLDRKAYPHTVDPVGDALLSAVLLLSGPCGLAGLLFMMPASKK